MAHEGLDMSLSSDSVDIRHLQRELRAVLARPPGAALDLAARDLATTGHAVVLRIEARLERLDRAAEDRLVHGPVDDLAELLGARRRLRASRDALRRDLDALAERRRAATLSRRVAGRPPRRDWRRRAS